MKKEIQKTKKTYSEDYVGAILEEIRGDFKAFGEQQQFLVEGQKRLEQDLGDLAKRVDKIDLRLGGMDSRFDSMDSKLARFEEKTDKNFKVVFEYMSGIDDEIISMKSEIKELKAIFKGKPELQRVLEMEKRLVKVEKLVFSKA